MLSDHVAVPTLPVRDLERARDFYSDTLGLEARYAGTEGVFYGAGPSALYIYTSTFAGTNQATSVSFQIPSAVFDEEIARLRERGMTFQTFEADGVSWQDDVAVMGELKAVWLVDPDGNIINLQAMPSA